MLHFTCNYGMILIGKSLTGSDTALNMLDTHEIASRTITFEQSNANAKC